MRQSNQQRRYGFACSSCRRRKSRCNGAFPTCDRCAASRESCKYDKSPSVAYTISLQDKLKAYEEKFERLRRADSKERAAILSNSTPAPGRGSRAPSISQETHGLSPETGGVSVSNLQTTESPNETSIGLDGRVCFYGKTSLYHVEPLDDDSIERNHPGQDWRSDQSSNQNTISGDLMSCTVSEISTFADNSRTSVLSEVPIDLLNELIEVYWCWPHHLHLVLCKHLFLRDLFISGPFVTSFLLYAVLAQAARYSTRSDASQIGQGFADKALQLLPQEIDHGSSIPTIQGLLILSARECACGRTSQGWLYSGMAFRMMRDIGVHIEPKKLGHLARQFSHEEIAIRQQVFWACYTWDKTISLCLGRVPIIHDTIQLPTTDILLGGQEADDEIWKPVSGQRYQAESLMEQKALGSARFAAYCKLCIIIDGVLDTLYSRPHSAQKDHLLGYLNKTCRELENWSSSLAEGLFMQPSQKPLLCPPLHILLMNLQYHATMILLCRPYRTISSNAKRLCTEAAQMIDSLFTLHVRRFGFRFVTYLQTYTMFVAASINVCDYKENHSRWISEPHLPEDRILLAQEASARLDFGLEVLRQASSTPSAGRCAAIIAQLLQAKDPPHRASGQERQQEENCSLATRNSAENTSNEALMSNRVFTPNSLAAGLGHNAERPTQEPLQDLQPQETFEVRDNQSTRIPESKVPGPSLLPDNSHQPYLSSNDSALDGNVNYQGQGIVNSQTFSSPFQFPRRFSGPGTIETPVRWLPENMQDDGSWMLMTDTELDFGSLSNF